MASLKEVFIAGKMLRLSDEAINNILFDLRKKYNISPDDWLHLGAGFSTVTQRQILDKIGKKNDDYLSGGNNDQLV